MIAIRFTFKSFSIYEIGIKCATDNIILKSIMFLLIACEFNKNCLEKQHKRNHISSKRDETVRATRNNNNKIINKIKQQQPDATRRNDCLAPVLCKHTIACDSHK